MVTAATIHLSLLGLEGIQQVAAASHANTRRLLDLLTALPGVERVFEAPLFHEAVVRLPCPVAPVLEKLEGRGILGGLDLRPWYPELGHALLLCATETKTEDDLAAYAAALADCLKDSAC